MIGFKQIEFFYHTGIPCGRAQIKRDSLAVGARLGVPCFDVEVLAAASDGNDTAQSPPAV